MSDDPDHCLQEFVRVEFGEGGRLLVEGVDQTLPLHERVLAYLDRLDNVPVKIGFSGQAGAGKSTLINAIRGLSPPYSSFVPPLGAAPVGVEQTTLTPTEYAFLDAVNVKLVDLPGVGTVEFPAEGYSDRVGLAEYDLILIIYSTRLSENDVELAKIAKRMNKPYWFVRSKADEDIINHVRSNTGVRLRDPPSDGAHVDEVRKSTLGKLKQNLAEVWPDGDIEEQAKKCFLVSGVVEYADYYDFPALRRSMLRELPSLKANALLTCIHTFEKDMIDRKVAFFRKQLLMYALLSAAGALIPVPGTSFSLDLAMTIKFVNRVSSSLAISKERLQAAYRDHPAFQIAFDVHSLTTRDGLLQYLSRQQLAITSTIVEEGVRMIPYVGPLIAAAISGTSTYFVFKFLLSVMEKMARDIAQALLHSNHIQDTGVQEDVQGVDNSDDIQEVE